MTDAGQGRIEAAPTKAFFIDTLIKDIQLIPAIVDLVDNSTDGARRIRGVDGSFDGLFIRIGLSKDRFIIADNCGGIPVEVARNYAFRFGRASGAPTVDHSVGQFGVGMKRALFKLGTHFVVESVTESHRFVVEVDVNEWQQDDSDWHFDWSHLESLTTSPPEDELGTEITVQPLHESVSDDFGLTSFASRLDYSISRSHRMDMERGLVISVNGVPVGFEALQLLADQNMIPAFEELEFEGGVHVKIVAGLAPSKPSEAGWYIFCNGRQVLGADQTPLTGWGGAHGINLPRFHNQYARFRGYVFFDADNAALLPWNTTKTSVDADSDVYRSTRSAMVKAMRPVISFLNRLDEEKEVVGREAVGPLEEALEQATATPVARMQRSAFSPPKPISPPVDSPKMTRLAYSRPVDTVEAVKKHLGASSNREVGERTFDYFIEMEEIETDGS